MTEETVLHDWDPSPETLQRWAYDENLHLDEQDEDLALGRRDFLPILIPIADDTRCPKADYILSSLDFYLMFLTLRGNDSELSALDDAIAIARDQKRPEIVDWSALLQRRLKYRIGVGPVDRTLALKMGNDLLNGICRQSKIAITNETDVEFEVQLSVPPFHRHKEWLTINRQTGTFSFRR
ncbi:hypothetical protein [Gimesia aquarii]|uniref:Uncharacterized protein n=1 Tax=Gimesia aquarii TaxID=2527964 RepID=A0A517WPZ5_9PLAN|nr:hypothetical protein [Gimesia aquarii]QDU07331.1 hypothetical protein V202x_06830 [Gimesia aquarii]